MAAFRYSLLVLKIYSARYVYYRFSVLAVNIETQLVSVGWPEARGGPKRTGRHVCPVACRGARISERGFLRGECGGRAEKSRALCKDKGREHLSLMSSGENARALDGSEGREHPSLPQTEIELFKICDLKLM